MATENHPCPSCESEASRQITTKELRERNKGKDPLVVTMPLICTKCGNVWDAPLSSGKCYMVAMLAAVGCVLGIAVSLASAGVVVWAMFIRPNNDGRSRAREMSLIGGLAVLSFSAAIAAGVTCRKYLRRARAQ
jgi:hypothetical protein